MNESSKNESSKPVNKRMYALLTVSVMLMVLGVFGCFYTLAENINTQKLQGKTCAKWVTGKIVYKCNSGDEYKNGHCYTSYNESVLKKCKDGYKYKDFNKNLDSKTCYRFYDVEPECEKNKGFSKTIDSKGNVKCTKCSYYAPEQLNIACYMKVDGKDTDVKKIGKAYTDNYIYCKTNQKGASWSVDGINSKDMKLYNYTVRFKYSDAKDKAVVKVSKSEWKDNKTSFKVVDKCDIDVKTSNNTISISATCDSNNALYKTYVLDRNNTIKGYNEYTKDYGKSKTKTIKLSKGQYNLQIQSINKKGKIKTLKKTVDVPGSYYASTFNLGDDKRCKVSDFEIENKNVKANLACGKNAKITKITLVNLTTSKTKDVKASKYSSYGYNGSISIPVSDEDDYRLRVYYSINDNDNIGVRSFVSTTEQPLIMYCPDNVRVGDKFICYVKNNFDGTNITLTSGKSKKSSNGKRALGTSVKKAGTVNASAVYKSQKFNKKIKVLSKSDISKEKVDLYCNRHGAKVNQKFYCSSTIDGVTIKISGGGCKLSDASGNQFTTSFKNGGIKYHNFFTCSSKGKVTVIASKKGYKSKTFTITVQ